MMRRSAVSTIAAALGAAAILVPMASLAFAQDATPVADRSETLVLIEHNDNITEVDQTPPGPSAGDWLVWGPNPLYDETDTTDTGATTQGTCFALHTAPDCYANETIAFPDGSTLEIQGIERGNAAQSTRTIVGGSGRYLGAAGTVTVAPTSDQAVWTKTLAIVFPPAR